MRRRIWRQETLRSFALLAIGVCGANAAALPLKAAVFTGAVEISSVKAVQPARLALIPYVHPGEGEPGTAVTAYAAVVTVAMGSLSGPEYASLHYPSVRYNSQLQEFLLLPEAASEGKGKLPTIRLRFAGPGKLQGTFSTPAAGFVGNMELVSGGAMPSRFPSLEPLAGIYRGNCPFRSSSSRLTAIQLVASRLPFKAQQPMDAVEGAVNYVGTAACSMGIPGVSDELVCAAFDTGIYSAYRGDLLLIDDVKTPWRCRRDASGNHLTCQSQGLSECTLMREKPRPGISISADASVERRQVFERLPSIDPATDRAPAAPGKGACGAWDGTYTGKLRHAALNRIQHVTVRLATLLLSGPQPPVRCAIQGTASLHFGPDASEQERITSVFPEAEFIPSRPEQVLFPDKEGDAILQVTQGEAGRLEGNWYSKRYGLVGSFEAASDGTSVPMTGDPVFGIAGKYAETSLPHSLSLSVIPTSGEPKSSNPFGALTVVGWKDISVARIELEDASYDYFSNLAVLDFGSSFLVGTMDRTGFHYTRLNKKFQSASWIGKAFHYARR